MTKKIYALALIALTLGTASAFAQKTYRNPGCKHETTVSKQVPCVSVERADVTPATRPDCRQDRLLEGIELTAEQKAKVEELKQNSRKERDAQMEKARKKAEKKMEKRDKEMKKILTPAQYEQYKANAKSLKKSSRMEKAGKRHDGKHRKHDGKHAGKHGKDSRKHRHCEAGEAGENPQECCPAQNCPAPCEKTKD